jgi:uncharacterized protein (DUF362 family)/Pyruvate/2-oxoacid:ferredoxin oxidoreductase delta subunit
METVSITTSAGYEIDVLRQDMIRLLEPLGGMSAFVCRGDRVLLKPNLLAAKEPGKSVTTHPAVVQVVAELVSEAGGIVVVGDSPGIGSFLRVAEKSGIAAAAEQSGAELLEFKEVVEIRGGGTFRSIELAGEYYGADKIINLPKLKTHEMMTMTCAVKNLFGAVIGAQKAAWHLKAGRSQQLFARLLLEIYLLKKPALNIVDAITAMEGNGPSSGDPINLNVLIAGVNPVAVDVIAGKVAGISADLLPIEQEAVNMRLPGALFHDITVCGAVLDSLPNNRLRLPAGLDTQFGIPPFLSGILKNKFTSHPEADPKTCILCGVCRDVCPPKAITIKNSALSIDKSRCIRCWCCRELCPHNAIRTGRGILLKVLLAITRK